MIKPALNFYPYSSIYAPYTQNKQNLLKFLMKFTGCTQKQFVKRFIWLLIVLWFAKAIATGKLSMKTYRKWKSIISMVGGMLPMLMK